MKYLQQSEMLQAYHRVWEILTPQVLLVMVHEGVSPHAGRLHPQDIHLSDHGWKKPADT